jgi:hypothetical protein
MLINGTIMVMIVGTMHAVSAKVDGRGMGERDRGGEWQGNVGERQG